MARSPAPPSETRQERPPVVPVLGDRPPVPTLGAPRLRAPRRRTRRGLAIAAMVPGLVAAALVLLVAGDEEAGLESPLSAPALARLADFSPAVGIPKQPETLHPVIPVEGRASLRVGDLEPLEGGIRPAAPGRIEIPGVKVDAGIEAVQANDHGIEVPPQGWAGWYDAGPRPGEPGRAVIIGHLDSKDGPGVFARVPSLESGDEIKVTDDRGEVHRYSVVGVTQVEKARFPTGSVYGHSRNPVLVLVTCGGPYVAGRGYRDNILVYARLA